jgi:hypothetical protein
MIVASRKDMVHPNNDIFNQGRDDAKWVCSTGCIADNSAPAVAVAFALLHLSALLCQLCESTKGSLISTAVTTKSTSILLVQRGLSYAATHHIVHII